MKTKILAAIVSMGLAGVHAAPLTIVNVGAPAINCVFDPTCSIFVTDTTDTIALPGGAGTGFLQSRTFTGQPGSPAAGLYGYEYRIDLREMMGITFVPCIDSLTIDFGPVVNTLDYNGDAAVGEEVYVVTMGGSGTVAPVSADQVGRRVTFRFGPPVCARASTYFFGLACTEPPREVTAQVHEIFLNTVLDLRARAPGCPNPKVVYNSVTGQVRISWTGSGQLYGSTDVIGPYDTLASATSPFTFTPSGSTRFFRVRCD